MISKKQCIAMFLTLTLTPQKKGGFNSKTAFPLAFKETGSALKYLYPCVHNLHQQQTSVRSNKLSHTELFFSLSCSCFPVFSYFVFNSTFLVCILLNSKGKKTSTMLNINEFVSYCQAVFIFRVQADVSSQK